MRTSSTRAGAAARPSIWTSPIALNTLAAAGLASALVWAACSDIRARLALGSFVAAMPWLALRCLSGAVAMASAPRNFGASVRFDLGSR